MKIEDVNKSVVEIEKVIVRVTTQLERALTSIDTLNRSDVETAQELRALRLEISVLRLEVKAEIAVVKKDIDELRRWTEKNGVSELKAQFEVLKEKVAKIEAALEKIGTRAWSVVPNVAGAIVNVLLAALVAFVVAKYGK